jgi:negative regulator of flagellin synthesis FlgM
MKIINNLYKLDPPLSSATNGPAKPGATSAAAAESAIHLSELSSQLHRLESSLTSEPGFDAARVEQIKTAIRDGDYQVNAQAVADKVIQSIRELSGLTHKGNA